MEFQLGGRRRFQEPLHGAGMAKAWRERGAGRQRAKREQPRLRVRVLGGGLDKRTQLRGNQRRQAADVFSLWNNVMFSLQAGEYIKKFSFQEGELAWNGEATGPWSDKRCSVGEIGVLPAGR